MVVFEEHGGDPDGIVMEVVSRDNICAFVSPFNQGDVKTWKSEDGVTQKFHDLKPEATLQCEGRKVMQTISFADFGNPDGVCGDYMPGNCSNPLTKQIVEKVNCQILPILLTYMLAIQINM